MKRVRVMYLEARLTKYNVPFHEQLRARLAEHDIQYDTIFGQPRTEVVGRKDDAHLDWAKLINNKYYRIGGHSLVWQPALGDIWRCDLAILGQENRRLVNYVAQSLAHFRPSRVALCGHGKNFQASSSGNSSERWKRFWSTHCDWWFGYTEESRRIVAGYGFPKERITVFNNAVDTSQLRLWADEISDEELDALRRRLGIAGRNVGIYVGALYDIKRIAFLLEASAKIRARVPDFTLIVVGGGPDQPLVERAAAENPWIKYLGPRFGREKAMILRLGRTFLMPGAIGLAILDCSALGVPMITTDYPLHGPESAYLADGESGLIVKDWRNSDAYADCVATVLRDDGLQARLAEGARRMSNIYTLENMIERFAEGIQACLSAPKRTGRLL